ncbi:MAG TPA: hypothetical protein VM142_10945 [Acidimicrobiales bacterium]|nr:hypothetical protein [Acidimicrobiales bacterium]
MLASDLEVLVAQLAGAFGQAVDVTPNGEQVPHILLPAVEVPEPWRPSPARALTVWENWPGARPLFYVDERVVGESAAPPRSNHTKYLLGESWRGFSYNFAWAGDDPVRAVQFWLSRFTAERS